MRYRLLGPLDVTRQGDHLRLGGPKQRLVLAHLLIRANHVVAADTLIDEIWGEEPPEAARASLQSYVSNLRRALGPGCLMGQTPGYVLHAQEEEIDSLRFEALVTRARGRLATDPATAAQTFRDALRLWEGEPLADLASELSLQPEIERLSELRLGAEEELIEAQLAIGRHVELVPELERLVTRHPLREHLFAQLMVALYRAGRQAEALGAYQRLRVALSDELGLDPSNEVEQLQQRILNQDPSLDLGGEPLRGYRLIEQIGSGPLGLVHRALEPQTERDVAIKVIGPRLANDSEFIRRFDPEARRVFRLEHPHIVPLYDWWREPDAAYLVMRLMRGGSLEERLGSGPILPDDALAWSEQIGSALAAVHRQGIFHGDIRAGNVLFDSDGNAYLSDVTIGHDAVLFTSRHRGTPSSPYLAPERAAGGPPSAPADVYALAALLGEVLREVELGSGATELLASFERARSPLPNVRPESPRELVAAVRNAILSPALTPVEIDLPAGPARNPYKGLRPFEEADAADFVGREGLVHELVGRLAESGEAARLLAVVGPSGSGKSSVVSAGLVPALRGGALPGSDRWLLIAMTPGHRPFDQLERQLLGVAVTTPAALGELLEAAEGFRPVIERVLPESAELLVFIDQFEELFSLTDEPTRDRFLSAIARTIDDDSSRVRFVITLRADFYDRALRHEPFGRLLAVRTHGIPLLGPGDLERVVVEPAEKAGLRLERGLATRIVAEMDEQPGGLPLLQYALTELWERRDGPRLSLAAYEASGGVGGAVGRRAERLVSQLDAEGAEAARQLFLRLVEPGEGAPDTSRRIRSAELQALVPNAQAMDSVIDSFARYRLLLLDRHPDTREPTVELAHEALLHAWPRLEEWVDEARDDLRNQRRHAHATAQWSESGRDPSFLLAGSRLEQADQWARASRVMLAPIERDYLAASLAERERMAAEEKSRRARETAIERRALTRLRGLVLVLGLGALAAASLSLFAWSEGQRAAGEARIATARELSAAAVANLAVDPERSILLALAAVDATRAADGLVLPEAQEALHQAVVASRIVLTVPGEGGYVDWVDNATLGSVFVTQGIEESGMVNVRDTATGEVLRSWRADEIDVNDVAFSADGSLLATTGDDGYLKLWNPATSEELARWGGPEETSVWGPSFSPDGSQVAAAWFDNGMVRVFDVETHATTLELADLASPYRTSFSPDGSLLAIARRTEPAVLVVDPDTGDHLHAAEENGGGLTDAVFSPDGRWLATASDDKTAKIYEADTGRLRFTLFGHTDQILDLDWSPDSHDLLTAGVDGLAKLWEISDAGPRELLTFSSQDLRGGVGGVAFSPDGGKVITAQYTDLAVKIWDIGLGGDSEWANFPADQLFPGLAYSLDADRLAASMGQGSVATWQVGNADPVGVTHLPQPDMILGLAISADGTFAAGAGGGGTDVWDVTSGQLRFTVVPDGTGDIWNQAVAWSPVADILATASVAGPLRIVDSTGKTLKTLDQGPGVGVFATAFSPDGKLVAAAVKQDQSHRWDPAAQRVTIWDWRRGDLVMTIQTSSVGLAFDPSGTRLATANVEAGVAEIWDVASGKKLVTLTGHSGSVSDVAWDPDPDRDRIATASSDTTVRLWNATTGVLELVLHGHTNPVWHVRFSADGSRLASASLDGSVRVWALDLDDLIEIATNEVTRTLTDAECRQFLHLAECFPEALESPAASSSTGGSPISAPSRGELANTPPNPFNVLDHFSRSVTGVVTPVPGSSPEGIGLAVGPDGLLYVADLDQKVSVVDPTTGKRIRSWGRPGTGNGEFGDDPLKIAVASDGRVYVLDRANGRIEVFAPDGTYQRQMGGFGDAEGQFHDIWFLTLGKDGSVYVLDWDTAAITKFDEEGAFVWRVGGEEAPDPDLQHGVYSLTVMKDGNILAMRDEGGAALLLDPSDGSVIGHWPGEDLIGDSGEPSVDAAGNVYVYQYVPRAIQIFSPEGALLGGVYFEDAIYEDYELYPAPVFTSDGHGWSFDQTLGLVELEIDLPTPLASPSPLPEGTYQTGPIPTATLKAAAEAAGFKWDASRWPGKTTVWAIRLENGLLYWLGSSDGAPLELSSSGTYRVTDAHTVAYADGDNPSSTFNLTFSLEGDVLTTHVDPDPPDVGIEAVIFFNSAPFVRQP